MKAQTRMRRLRSAARASSPSRPGKGSSSTSSRRRPRNAAVGSDRGSTANPSRQPRHSNSVQARSPFPGTVPLDDKAWALRPRFGSSRSTRKAAAPNSSTCPRHAPGDAGERTVSVQACRRRQLTGRFRPLRFATAYEDGLLIPRSLVRSQHGPLRRPVGRHFFLCPPSTPTLLRTTSVL